MISQQGMGAKLRRLPVISSRRFAAAFALCAGFTLLGLIYEYTLLIHTRDSVKSSAAVIDDQKLNIVTRISLNTYYESENGPSGFEYELLTLFADSIGKELVVQTADTLNDLFARVSRKEVAIASAGLTPTPQRLEHFSFSTPYLINQPIVVYKVGNYRPRNYQDLTNKNIVVVANSSHAATLSQVKNTHKTLAWRELNNADFVDILGRIESGEVDYTIIDSAEFMLHQGSFPGIKRAFDFGEEQSFSWMFAKTESGHYLRDQANAFLERIRTEGTLAQLEERFFGQSSNINQVAANEFAKNIKQRLPNYIENIKKVAHSKDMDWRLLAAISYQESRWNPKAKSPTGVRGMMMLTLPTARELGITNRLDIDQSLFGGATYYQQLKKRLPARIQEPDRSWLALAAYNVGFGHLEDARRLTQGLGKDPDSWYHVKQNLPLLRDPDWHPKTRYGYARGNEPVHYVQKIRHYYNVLVWQDLAKLKDGKRDDLSEIILASNRQNNFPSTNIDAAPKQASTNWLAERSAEQLLTDALSSQEEKLETHLIVAKNINNNEITVAAELISDTSTIPIKQSENLQTSSL